MRPILYSHGGSLNHGCEAIVRTFEIESNAAGVNKPVLVSMNSQADNTFGLGEYVDIVNHKGRFSKCSLSYIKAYLMNRLFHKYEYLDCMPCLGVVNQFDKTDVAFSIGGDNYSYIYDPDHTYLHNLYRKQGLKTILWACSINPELIQHPKILADLRNFDCITARESITFNAMLECGLKNVHLIPDLAFILPRQECEQSALIEKGKYVGLNLSCWVMSCDRGEGAVSKNYRELINYILKKTDYKVALIPHVVWSHDDDRKAMLPLYEEFKSTGRVVMIEDHNCMQLKDIIARCRFFIGARTHATIAAYSSCVPTFVLGYSVKARGIAKDIFGTEENYVIDVQNLKSETDLTESFKWMEQHEQAILDHYHKVMPAYIESVHKSQEIIKKFLAK